MRVKICGITTCEDALAAAEAGADAIGLNFVGGPRRVDSGQAEKILASLPLFVTPVALVRLHPAGLDEETGRFLAEQRIRYVQAYGVLTRESVAALRHGGYEPLVVLPVGESGLGALPEWFVHPDSRPAGYVLDTYHPAQAGGTGRAFDWACVRTARESGALDAGVPVILAGGLRPENVAEAIRMARPDAVDVSSGVEIDGAPGRKDPVRMRAFVQAVRQAQETQ